MGTQRPYFNASGPELEKLVKANPDNPKILAVIAEELTHRTTARMKTLHEEVKKTLSKVKTRPVSPELPKPSTPNARLDAALKYRPPLPDKDLTRTTPESNGAAQPASSRKPAPRAAPALRPAPPSELLPPDDEPDPMPASSGAKGAVRPSGALKGLPSKYVFNLKNEVHLNIEPGTPLVKQYVFALAALISEMKKAKTASTRVLLEGGVLIPLGGNEVGYQFRYDGDADLFEGASVTAVIGGTQSAGTLVGVIERQLILKLDADFGPRVSACTIIIDNTAMLEALRQRLDKVSRGEAPGFSLALAEKAVLNIGDEVPATKSIVGDLNPSQSEAVQKALANEISYVWGPPGTGKTQTLSALCLRLFQDGKRVLLCSNTNQAVDQVLLKLCRTFTKDHPALVDGKVVRIGRIQNKTLETEWRPYVDLDGIVERKSEHLRKRKTEIELALATIAQEAAPCKRVAAAFSRLDEVNAAQERLLEENVALGERFKKSTRGRSEAAQQMETLRKELEDIDKAGAFVKVFKRSAAVVQKDIDRISSQIVAFQKDAQEAQAASQALQPQREALATEQKTLGATVRGYSLKDVLKKVEVFEEQQRPLQEELRKILKALEDIAKTVLNEARIIGATVTKAYLSPQMFSAFDVVVVDEASMVMVPALFHSAGLAKERVVISGDYRQLSAIVPTEQQEIDALVGGDVFRAAGLDTDKPGTAKRMTMLAEQYRMDDRICRLISGPIYGGNLRTAAARSKENHKTPPYPFDSTLTIIDTTSIMPFVSQDRKSRYNLMNALAVRNLCRHLSQQGYADSIRDVGICTPYVAQAKVLRRLLKGCQLDDKIDSGTVHRYQGDEKRTMIIDLPDSLGERMVGIFLQADNPSESGARLLNVAISRAQAQVIVVANLGYLDTALPAHAMLRDILAQMQALGRVIDVRDVLALWPVTEDLRRLGHDFDLTDVVQKTGLFGQRDFEQVLAVDLAKAKKSVAIYSGFVTPQRVATYEASFRSLVSTGVKIRCVTRPSKYNGSIPPEHGKAALDGLEAMGCIVDTRKDIHQKVVIIDDETLWFGSLNPLSHTSATSEMMARVDSRELALQMATFLSLTQQSNKATGEGLSVVQENPRCGRCGSRAGFFIGKFGPYWQCEDCDWTESLDKPKQAPPSLDPSLAPLCPQCGGPTKPRTGRYGEFYGCANYPNCKGMVSPKKTGTRRPPPKKTSRKGLK